jgi:hypothetical protein
MLSVAQDVTFVLYFPSQALFDNHKPQQVVNSESAPETNTTFVIPLVKRRIEQLKRITLGRARMNWPTMLHYLVGITLAYMFFSQQQYFSHQLAQYIPWMRYNVTTRWIEWLLEGKPLGIKLNST